MDRFHILILDDNQFSLKELSSIMEAHNQKIYCANNPSKAWQILKLHLVDILFCNINLPQMSGLDFLKQVKEKYPLMDVIIMSAGQDSKQVIQAFRKGASDFIRKPFTKDDILEAIRRTNRSYQSPKNKVQCAHQWSLISQQLRKLTGRDFIGRSNKIKEVLRLAELVSGEKDINILVTGENGTGKEIIARIIHHTSNRRNNRFCAINCAAVPDTLIESEFFGHKKGTFTGAIEDKKGCFEQAHNGTLFLDEISEMPIGLQAKLLRAIEEKRIKPLGSNKELHCNFRIISATNAKPDQLLAEERLRVDLYHRLNTFVLHIPPLRERKEDITPLTCHFVNQIAERRQEERKWIHPEVFNYLKPYPFPGNVRELRNMVERAMLLSNKEALKPEHFHMPEPSDKITEINETCLNMEENEKQLIMSALIKCNFNYTKTAKILGISRDTLVRKKAKYKIDGTTIAGTYPPNLSN